MKKFFKSRGFLITMLSVCCVAILGICWAVNRDKNSQFTADEPPPSTASQEWVESSSETAPELEETTRAVPETTLSATTAPAETTTAEYPKIAEKTEKDVAVEFSPTEKPTETPPAPEGKTIMEYPGPEHPGNPAPDVTAPAPEAESAPAPGSTDGNGAYYDPVFGWVTPAEVIQSTIDSDGDPDKMVGNMGD